MNAQVKDCLLLVTRLSLMVMYISIGSLHIRTAACRSVMEGKFTLNSTDPPFRLTLFFVFFQIYNKCKFQVRLRLDCSRHKKAQLHVHPNALFVSVDSVAL